VKLSDEELVERFDDIAAIADAMMEQFPMLPRHNALALAERSIAVLLERGKLQ
jgi:hypothetical protein